MSTTRVVETGRYKNTTSSVLVLTGVGYLLGVFVASASNTPTIKMSDDLTGSNVLVNTFTPSAGTFYPMPAHVGAGIYITISGTVDCTVFFREA